MIIRTFSVVNYVINSHQLINSEYVINRKLYKLVNYITSNYLKTELSGVD